MNWKICQNIYLIFSPNRLMDKNPVNVTWQCDSSEENVSTDSEGDPQEDVICNQNCEF